MVKHCLDKWNENHKRLEESLRKDTELQYCEYGYLVKKVVEYILGDEWDSEKITVVDNGDYQGTQLFLMPKVGYQPEEYEYLMTYVGYGSCSGCDTLLEIQSYSYDNDLPTEQQLKDYMTLCKHLVDNMIKPYNTGWRNDPRFNTIEAEPVEHGRWI